MVRYLLGTCAWLAVAVLALGVVGCGSSSGSGSAQARIPPAMDMVAVGRYSGVLIFRNVLYKQFGDIADVHLLQQGSNNDGTVGVFVADNRLFASAKHDDRLYIWNDYANVTSHQSADVELWNMDGPNRMFVYNNDLYVSVEHEDRLLIFRDVANLSSGPASPDVILTDGINRPKDVVCADDAVYVASDDGDTVSIWRGLATLTDFQSADVKLRSPDSIIVDARRLAVHADTLYVTNRDHSVVIFRNASLLMDDAVPDAVLGGPSDLDHPRRVMVDDYRLYIPNRYGDVDDDEAAISIFNNPLSITFGQVPDVAYSTDMVSRVPAASLEDNVLAGFSRESDSFFFFIQAHAIEEDSEPDLTLWDPRIRYDNIAELILVPR